VRKTLSFLLFILSLNASASDIIPIGNGNNKFYYKIGGGSDFALPPVSDTTTVRLDASANLGMGNSCGAFNPALSITNTINDLKDSADNLEQSIVASATGSLVQLPMYLLAQANPTAYNLLNNTLLSAHKKLEISTKSCEIIKDQIANGQNPYQDWGTIAVNDQWKKHLSLVSSGNEDINYTKKDIDAHTGDDGVPWVQGKNDSDAGIHAGGKSQPSIHVIADTVKAGYNAMLNRDLQSEDDAPDNASNNELRHFFTNPKSAINWTTNVIGDQVITTCNNDSCKKQQGSLVGHGLLPWVTSCKDNKDDCADTIRDDIGRLVTGSQAITKDNLSKVSADGIAISPDVIASIRGMDATQQKILINKLSQEIAVQRVMDKAFVAKNILSMGSQVPVIAANHPAQVVIVRSIANLDNDIRSLAFESEMRKKTVSDTLAQTMNYADQQQQNAMRMAPVSSASPLMEDGAIPKESSK
jgi:integrating conjugative element protein (TIGR03755 family)